MKKLIEKFFQTFLIFLLIACHVQQQEVTQTVLPPIPITPTPDPLIITVDNVSSLRLQKTIGAGTVNDVAWSPKGDVIAVAQDFDILFYDSNSLQLINEISFGGLRPNS